MKMAGSVLSGARPPNSAKLIAPETEMWAEVVKLSGVKTAPMTALGQGLKDDQSVLAPIKPAAGWLVRASSKEMDGAGGHDRGRACASNYLIATLIAVTCVLQPGADFTGA
jgi:hypothetical protein